MKHYIIIFLTLLPVLAKSQFSPSKKKEGVASITVQLENAMPTDTLMLMYFKDTMFNEQSQNGDYVELKSPANTGLPHFKVPVNEDAGYFFIAKKMPLSESAKRGNSRFAPLTTLLKAEAGDDVTLKIRPQQTKFNNFVKQFSYDCSGVGYQKYKLKFMLDSFFFYNSKCNLGPIFDHSFTYNPDSYFKHAITATLSHLDSMNPSISPDLVKLLKADYTYSNFSIFDMVVDKFIKLSEDDKVKFRNAYMKSLGEVNLSNFSPEILFKSRLAVSYFLAQAQTTILISGKAGDPDALYSYLCQNYSGMVLDKLLVYYFVKTSVPESFRTMQLEDAIKRVKTPSCLMRLELLSRDFITKELGKEYDLKDVNGQSVALQDFKGKVLLVDFWFTGCGFCRDFAKTQLSKVEEYFKADTNVVFLSISVDKDREVWLKSVRSQEYSPAKSIHLSTLGFGLNHPLIKRLSVQGYPTLLILDQKGAIIEFGAVDYNTPNLYEATLITEKIKSHL